MPLKHLNSTWQKMCQLNVLLIFLHKLYLLIFKSVLCLRSFYKLYLCICRIDLNLYLPGCLSLQPKYNKCYININLTYLLILTITTTSIIFNYSFSFIIKITHTHKIRHTVKKFINDLNQCLLTTNSITYPSHYTHWPIKLIGSKM